MRFITIKTTLLLLVTYLSVNAANYKRIDHSFGAIDASVCKHGAMVSFWGQNVVLVYDSTLRDYKEIYTPFGKSVFSCLMLSPDTLFFASYDHILYRTTNGGLCYDSLYQFPGMVHEMKYLNNTLCITVTKDSVAPNGLEYPYSRLYQSTNYGTNLTYVQPWLPVYLPKYLSKDTIIFSTYSGNSFFLRKTYDGGNTILPCFNTTLDPVKFYDFWGVDTGILYAGFAGIKKTTNGGASWSNYTFPTSTNYVTNIKYLSKDTIVLFGDGIIHMSVNGGNTWFALDTISTLYGGYAMFDIDPISNKGVMITRPRLSETQTSTTLSRTGHVAFTNDGGKRWRDANQQIHDPLDYWLYRLAAINDTTLFCYPSPIAGWDLDKMTTSKDGKTWQYSNARGQLAQFEAADFINDTVGFVCGLTAANKVGLLKTTNAGKSWQLVNSDMIGLYAMSYYLRFFDENNGVVYMDSRCFKTTNGGLTFSEYYEFGNQHIPVSNRPSFANVDTGFVKNGTSLRTTVNGGASWTYVSGMANGATDNIYALGANRVVVLNDSLLYYSTSGGVNYTLLRTFSHKGRLDQNPYHKQRNIYFFVPDSKTYIFRIDFNTMVFDSIEYGSTANFPFFVQRDTLIYAYQRGIVADADKVSSLPTCNFNIDLNATNAKTPCRQTERDTFYLTGDLAQLTHIRWYKDGKQIMNNNTPVFVTDSLCFCGSTIQVVVGNSCGCPITRTFNLEPTTPAQVNAGNNLTVCNGKPVKLNATGALSYIWSAGVANGDTVYPATTTSYTVTGTNIHNCTAIDTMIVTVNDTPYTKTVNKHLCNGKTYNFYGTNYSQAGTYTKVINNGNLCDSIITLIITTAANSTPTTSYAYICTGNSYNFYGEIKTQTNFYYKIFTNVSGCDSIVGLQLTVGNYASGNWYATICNGSSYYFNGQYLTQSGIYKDTIPTGVTGCDSIISLNLQVNSALIGPSINSSICSGSSYFFNGQNLTTAGVYKDTLTSSSGCDSIITLNLQVKPTATGSINASVCQGSSYSFNGQNLTAPGAYKDTLTSSTGCDSIITLNLQVKPIAAGSIAASICPGGAYQFNGQTLTAPGAYKDTLTSSTGCDSILTLNLQIKPTTTGNLSKSICTGGSYFFNGQNLTAAGVYKDTLTASNGCDSVVTLNLQVNALITNTVNAAICQGNSYYFNGVSLTAPGTYKDTLTAQGGCDSIVTLSLQVSNVLQQSVSATLCPNEAYSFNGQSLTAAGVYLDTLVSSGGCDSVVQLTLTAATDYVVTVDTAIQQGTVYVLPSGISVSAAGIYMDTLQSSGGCDSIITTNLSVISSITNAGNLSFDITVYPNPATNELYIDAGGNAISSVLIYNTIGSLVSIPQQPNNRLDISTLPGGIYIAQITAGGVTKKLRWVKL